MVQKTEYGYFAQDVSGLYHYKLQSFAGHITIAAEDAIKHKPKSPAWFWFNDTPAPIKPEDIASVLIERWEIWRRHQQNIRCFLELI